LYDYKDYYFEKSYLEDKWIEEMVSIVMKPVSKSINLNKNYINQLNKNAVVNVWNPNMGNTFSRWYSSIGLDYDLSSMYADYGEVSANLYFNNENALIDFNVSLSDNLVKRFDRILDKKINKKFFNYV